MGSYMHSKKLTVFDPIPDLPYNAFLDTDSYKASHWWMYILGMKRMFSYLESRGGRFSNIVFAGLQIIVNRYLAKPPTIEMFEEFAKFMSNHGPTPNLEQMKEVAQLGYWPVRICAVKEGSVVPVSNCIMTIESTDERYGWVANYLEAMLHRVWYPVTVATVSYHCRKIAEHYTDLTCTSRAGVKFMLQDFGARGVSSYESAEIGGAAHCFNFAGSDTIPGVRCANHYYKDAMAAFSVDAAEHSTITSWGGPDCEFKAFEHIVDNAKRGQIISVVSDSYDYFRAIDVHWPALKNKIVAKDLKLVIRPDSGNPVDIVTQSMPIIEKHFGATINGKGFKEFGCNVKIIYGDSITEDMMRRILQVAMDNGFAASNFVFGMGGALLQGVTRDTQKFAVKCSQITLADGKEVDVFKDPVTDPGKKSKRGKLDLEKRDGQYRTVKYPAEFNSELELVFEDGKIYRQQTLAEIRKIAHGEF